MRKQPIFPMLAFAAAIIAGCQSKQEINYLPLTQSGMFSASSDALKKLNITEPEIAQVAALKSAGMSDDMCVALFTAARDRHHSFSSAAPAKNLYGAGFTDEQILAMAKNDQLDIVGGEAVMLHLIGLSDSAAQTVLKRRMSGLPTMSAAEIGRLKNTQLTEREILARIENGMTDAQADAEATAREKGRAHSGTGFVRVHGRR
jgi:hypothetical protein